MDAVPSSLRLIFWKVEITPLNDPLKRDFYAEMCRIERWSVRTLRAKVQGMLFERTALSKKPAKLAEKDLEAAILRELEKFILELGVGLAFVDRQKRIIIDGDDEVRFAQR